jgi:hypothetical protein
LKSKELQQLRYLKNELRLLEREYHDAQSSTIVDCVTGSRQQIPFDKHVITIRGVDTVRLTRIRRRLDRKIQELLDEMDRLNDYIDSIEDSEMRQIMQLRYRNGLSWQEIAFQIGEHDESYPRKKHNRFLKLAENAEK